jgi:DNA-binding Xre family transcriptional regulator
LRETVANRTREQMQIAGIDASELAQRAGINESYVCAICLGRAKNPLLGELESIAIALNCRLADLVAGWPPALVPILEIGGTAEAGAWRAREQK